MRGLPVTIRLLDPPLHEFLPARGGRGARDRARADRAVRRPRASSSARSGGCTSWRRRTRCSAPAECGWACSTRRSTRCRRARSSAPRKAVAERSGEAPQLEIMIPLVAYEKELELMRELVLRVVDEEGGERPRRDHRDDDRAAARLLRGRPDRRARPTSSRSAPTTSRRPRSASRATTWRAASCRST